MILGQAFATSNTPISKWFSYRLLLVLASLFASPCRGWCRPTHKQKHTHTHTQKHTQKQKHKRMRMRTEEAAYSFGYFCGMPMQRSVYAVSYPSHLQTGAPETATLNTSGRCANPINDLCRVTHTESTATTQRSANAGQIKYRNAQAWLSISFLRRIHKCTQTQTQTQTQTHTDTDTHRKLTNTPRKTIQILLLGSSPSINV